MMANAHRGEVEILLDRPRKLRYDLNAFAEIEDRLGVGVQEIPKLTKQATVLRVLLWAGLIHEDPNLTLQDVGRMVTAENLAEVAEQVERALAAARPPEGPEPGGQGKPGAGTGRSSSG